MPGNGNLTAWDFLDRLYSVPKIKSKFDAAALHPYASEPRPPTPGHRAIPQGDDEPRRRGHAAVAHRGRLGIGGLPTASASTRASIGQQQMLSGSFKMILNHRNSLERAAPLLVPLARSAAILRATCSFCGSAGLLRSNRTPKPAYSTFRGFTAETTPPQASITAGPGQGSLTKDPTPSFSLASERGRLVPSRAGSMRAPPRPAARRTRPRCLQTATTPTSSRRSTPPETRARWSRGPSRWTPRRRR